MIQICYRSYFENISLYRNGEPLKRKMLAEKNEKFYKKIFINDLQ